MIERGGGGGGLADVFIAIHKNTCKITNLSLLSLETNNKDLHNPTSDPLWLYMYHYAPWYKFVIQGRFIFIN